jgi:DNA-directed RNA polymerase specialized sigma24 family protein
VNEVFETTPSNNDFERSVRELAQEAQRYPPLSSQRQIALNKLVNEILRSQRLVRPQKGLWAANFYEDLYNEALQKTLFDICQKIDNYNSEHSVLAWANFLIKNHFLLVVNDYKKKGITYMPKSAKRSMPCLPYLEDLDRYLPTDPDNEDDQILKHFLEEDPENLLANERLREHPEVTFQLLALAKFVEDRTWEEIATTLGISLQTLCSFFNRRLQKLLPYFKKYLQD